MRELTRLVRSSELSLAKFYALAVIGDSPGITQIQLAEKLGVDAPRAVVIVDSLEKMGLAQRSASIRDRRIRALRLTLAGQRVAEEVVQISTEFERALTSDISRSEQRTLIELLGRLIIDQSRARAADRR